MPFLFSKSMFYIPILKEILGKEEFDSVKYVYGSTACRWAGGRITLFEVSNIKIIEKVISSLLPYNLIPEFTLSNTTITKEDLEDKFCNELLKVINDTSSEVICASDLLFDYIKSKYPNIKTTASLIKFFMKKFESVEEETNYINELSLLYDRIVISNEYYLKNPHLDGIKDKSKLAIISNYTKHNCPFGKKHYELIGRFNRHEISYEEGFRQVSEFCPRINNPDFKEEKFNDEEVNSAINSGIKYLKVQGRDMDFSVMTDILFNNFFAADIDRNKLKLEIDKICSDKIQSSLDLQMYSLLKHI